MWTQPQKRDDPICLPPGWSRRAEIQARWGTKAALACTDHQSSSGEARWPPSPARPACPSVPGQGRWPQTCLRAVGKAGHS